MNRDDIVAASRTWIGTPYHHQASVRGVGADCLGLVRGVWREIIGPEPELPPGYTPLWRVEAGDEPLRDAAQKHLVEIAPHTAECGDVLLFRMMERGQARHAAIIGAPLTIIHAYSGHHVMEQELTLWWRRRVTHAFGFPGLR